MFLHCCSRAKTIAPSPGEEHEIRIQRDGQEEVAEDDGGEGPDGDEDADLPEVGHEAGEHDHHGGGAEDEDEGALELCQDLGHLLEEGGVLGLLGGGAPAHVDADHMADDGLADVEADAAEEDAEQRDPLEVLEDGGGQALLADAVAEDGEGEVAEGGEDEDEGEVDLEGVEVVVVQEAVEPADGEVVDDGEDPGAGDGVVGADVGHDGDLAGQRHAREHEVLEQRRQRALEHPVLERVEDELRAAVRVLLPARQLVVHGQRHALLEALARVAREAADVARRLQPQRHVEVLGHSLLGPVLLVAVVLARVPDLLHRAPAQDGVVPDEGRHVAVGHGVPDGRVDEVREEGDTLLEEARRHVHDARLVLDDGHLRVLLHLADGVEEAVGRHARVRVDEQDVVAHADVALGPRAALVLGDGLLQALGVRRLLVLLRPLLVPFHQQQLLLHAVADPHGIVHIGGLLELSASQERLLPVRRLGLVLRPRHPPDVVLVVEVQARLRLILADELHAVVVDEDVGRAALHLVRGDGRLDGFDGRFYDGRQAFFVDGHLDGDVRQRDAEISVKSLGWPA